MALIGRHFGLSEACGGNIFAAQTVYSSARCRCWNAPAVATTFNSGSRV